MICVIPGDQYWKTEEGERITVIDCDDGQVELAGYGRGYAPHRFTLAPPLRKINLKPKGNQ